MIPIAKRIKNKSKSHNTLTSSSSLNNNNVKLTSLDEQIAILERSLQSSSSSQNGSDDDNIGGSYDDDSSESVTIDDVDDESAIITEKDEFGNVIKFVSKSNLDRIKSLPKAYLPEPPQRRKHKNDHDDDDSQNEKANRKKLKKQKKQKKDGIDNKATETDPKNTLNGLESTIREMLRNYQPLSGDKIPFYCRICRYQGADLIEWNQHKSTKEHELASEIELKMSYCKLCRKQFTSPAQLKEHLNAKPHKQKLNDIKVKQSQNQKQRTKFS